MQDYVINWPVIIAIGALILAAWLATGLKDWAERNDEDDE